MADGRKLTAPSRASGHRRAPHVWRASCFAIALGVALIVGTWALADVLSFVPEATVGG